MEIVNAFNYYILILTAVATIIRMGVSIYQTSGSGFNLD